jgi:hypothetical protein
MPILFSVLPQVMPVEDIQRELGDMETLIEEFASVDTGDL